MKNFTKTKDTRAKDIQRKWYIADASGKVLGRFASKVARILTGKGKVEYIPHLDCGDYVVVVNAEMIRVTGKKLEQKLYFTHSGYPGGDKLTSLEKMLKEHPERVIKSAVKGMLPQNRLRDRMLKKLKIYCGNEHIYKKQKMEIMTL